jgi:hypothetical protein
MDATATRRAARWREGEYVVSSSGVRARVVLIDDEGENRGDSALDAVTVWSES